MLDLDLVVLLSFYQSQCSFCGVLRIFYIVSCHVKKENLTSSFLVLSELWFSSGFIALAGTSSATVRVNILNFVSFLNLRGNTLSFSPSKMVMALNWLYKDLIMWMYASSVPSLLRDLFFPKQMLTFY